MATYAATDLHGMYNLWKQIKNYLKEDDRLIFLGDAIDRGPNSWKVFTELMDDPRVTFIKGNHEDMMYNAFKCSGPAGSEWFKQWKKNDGQTTLMSIKADCPDIETKFNYIDRIRDLPTSLTYKNPKGQAFFLSHAGFTPNENWLKMYDFDRETYEIWNRKHFAEKWPEHLSSEIYCIHGHTPIQLMWRYHFEFGYCEDMPFVYCNGHKIDIDNGAFSSNKTILYNLDTNSVEKLFIGDKYE